MLELAVAALALLLAFVPTPPGAVERWYSTGIYPWIQRAVTPATNLLPFAVLDILLVAAVMAVVVVLVRAVRTALQTRRAGALLHGLGRIAVGAAFGYLVFLALWGFNYRRVPMSDRLLVERDAPSTDAVETLGLEAVARMNALYAPAHQQGWPEEQWRDGSLRDAFAATQRLLAPKAWAPEQAFSCRTARLAATTFLRGGHGLSPWRWLPVCLR